MFTIKGILLTLYNLTNYNKLFKFWIILFFLGFNINSTFCKGNIVGKNSYTRFHSSQNVNCQVCHVSTDSKQTIRDHPKWVERPIETIYSVYSSATLDAVVGQPTGSSKLCLSCHDGTVAIDDLGGQRIPGYANLGTDLGKNHPISFVYDDILAMKDGELYSPNSSTSGLGSTINKDMLSHGMMQCTSCHDAHGLNGLNKLLIKSNHRSRLCLTCHIK